MLGFVQARLPPETEVIGAQTESLQCTANPGPGLGAGPLDVLGYDDDTEADEIAVLAATFPEATARAFRIKEDKRGYSMSWMRGELADDEKDDNDEESGQQLKELLSLDPAPEIVVVYLTRTAVDDLVEKLQAAYPKAAIIGGIVMGQKVFAKGRAGASVGD